MQAVQGRPVVSAYAYARLSERIRLSERMPSHYLHTSTQTHCLSILFSPKIHQKVGGSFIRAKRPFRNLEAHPFTRVVISAWHLGCLQHALHTSAYVSIRQHTSAPGICLQHVLPLSSVSALTCFRSESRNFSGSAASLARVLEQTHAAHNITLS